MKFDENFASENLMIELGEMPTNVILEEINQVENIKKSFDDQLKPQDVMIMWSWV